MPRLYWIEEPIGEGPLATYILMYERASLPTFCVGAVYPITDGVQSDAATGYKVLAHQDSRYLAALVPVPDGVYGDLAHAKIVLHQWSLKVLLSVAPPLLTAL